MILALLPLALAHDDICPEGMQHPPNAAEACCWAAQVWDSEAEVCVGAPPCPAGLQVHGSSCVAVAEPADPGTANEQPAPQEALDGVFDSAALNSDIEGGSGGLVGGRAATSGDIDSAIYLGGVNPDEVQALVYRKSWKITTCYGAGMLDNPAMAGKLVVKFVIAEDGKVTSATTEYSELNDERVEHCINKVFLRFRFTPRESGGDATVTYPLTLAPYEAASE